MGITISGKIDLQAIAKRKSDAIQAALKTALQDEAAVIDQRTQRGQDVNGAQFAPYSKSYAKLREKRGRGDRVNLTDSGNMLQSMQTSIELQPGKIVGKIFFTATSAASLLRRGASASAPDKARWNNPRRKFFALAQSQIDRIKRKLKDALHGS